MSIPGPLHDRLDESCWSVLSGLRFVLAFSVMSCHTANAVGYHKWMWTFGAFPAVCGFFLISGYSIAASLDANPKGYFKRRLLRIYPMALAAVAMTLVLLACLGQGSTPTGVAVIWPSAGRTLATCLLLNGLLLVTPFIFQPLWSLGCEVLYYLAGPVLRFAPTAIIALLIVASAALFVLPIAHGHSGNYPNATCGLAAASLAWLWLIGFLAYRHPANLWLATAILLSGATMLAGYAVAEGAMALPLFILAGLAVCYLPKLSLPQSCVAPANYLGEISYPLYLVHFPLMLFLGRFLADVPVALAVPICWISSLLLAILFYHGIDRFVRTARNRYVKDSSRTES